MADDRIPVNIITGFLGVGKTTAILELLAGRPGGEPWAVLVNEFGKVPIDQAALRAVGEEGMQIAEVAGGCLCCTAGLNMTTAMKRLLNDASPARVLLEPTGLGHPDRIREMLFEGDFRDTLRPAASLCLIDPRQLTNPRFRHILAYWEQLKSADVLVINKTDLADESTMQTCRTTLAEEYPDKPVFETEQGRLLADWLDAGADAAAPPAKDHHPAHDHHSHADETVELLDGKARRMESSGLGRHACGWTFDPDIRFSHERLTGALAAAAEQPADPETRDALRIKGVFRTDRGCMLYNAVGSEATWQSLPNSDDSRLECIAGDHPLDWNALQKSLLAAIL